MYKHMNNHQPVLVQKNQQGIVAIVVTVILMIVLTLIVLSFAKISQREERNALDRQLSTQAFYAAESGINFAKYQLQNSNLNGDYSNNCHEFTDQLTPPVKLPKDVGSGSGNSKFTCLFVNSTQTKLQWTKTDSQIMFPYMPVPANTSGVTIYWDDDSGGKAFGGCKNPGTNPISLLPSCNASVLRIEVTDSSLSSSKVFFAYPSNSGSVKTFNFSSDSTGTAASTKCSAGGTPKKCSVSVSSIVTGSYIRLKGIYGAVSVTAVANSSSSLGGAQATIDATGKAADVERRIQVRVSISGLLKDPPPYGLDGTNKICKKFSIDNTNATDNGMCWAGGVPD